MKSLLDMSEKLRNLNLRASIAAYHVAIIVAKFARKDNEKKLRLLCPITNVKV